MLSCSTYYLRLTIFWQIIHSSYGSGRLSRSTRQLIEWRWIGWVIDIKLSTKNDKNDFIPQQNLKDTLKFSHLKIVDPLFLAKCSFICNLYGETQHLRHVTDIFSFKLRVLYVHLLRTFKNFHKQTFLPVQWEFFS